MIKQGNTELFGIDPKTGAIKTVRGLDYERESQHILIIGTVENTSDSPGSTTRVVVNVQVSIVVIFLDSVASWRNITIIQRRIPANFCCKFVSTA